MFPRLDGQTVLIVDDRAEILDMFEDGFVAAGARVLRATNVDEALVIVRSESIDALISDLHMPMRTGHDLVREVRRMPRRDKRELIAIAVTGRDSPGSTDPTASVRAGFDFHLMKPVMPDVLVRHIAAMIDRRQRTSGTLPSVNDEAPDVADGPPRDRESG
jgi:CheY-like chemotaxis protein